MPTILLLLASNIFMTIAWYLHLKGGMTRPLLFVILISWGIAFVEYCFAVPANRIGYASGWSAGQLDNELGTGSWLPAPPAMAAIFGEPGEATWRRVVRSIGGDGGTLEQQPPDVSWN